MIIYEVTNKYTTMDELLFSKYYPTKELALEHTASNLECYKLELHPLGREDIANIHDISYLIKSEVKIK